MTRIPAALLHLVAAAALTATVAGAAAQEFKLAPVDEAASDPGWARFKARLLEALGKRDQQFVLGILDAGIRNISERDGIAEFRKLWELNSADSPLWVELPKVLFLGGVFVKREKGTPEFCAPYVYYKWPEHADPDAGGAILVRDALAKAQPAAGSQTVQALSYDLVKVLDWEIADEDKANRQKWVRIELKTGDAYLPEEQIRSPLEYRACFVRSGAAWRMTSFEFGE